MVDPLARTVQPFKWRRKRKPLSQEIYNTYRTLVVTLLVLVVGTTSVFLYTSSLQPAKGYTLEQLQMDNESLQSDLRKLDRKVIEAQSFIHLESSEVIQKMEVAGNQDFSYVDDENGLAENLNSSEQSFN
jgi:hypothetical protein